ncbi:MAG: 2-oxoacid:acceptor oxidoreductase family protein [Candidatus Shikimatogenerans bostrichidophilus]|nr:MAG: 2-oxoacid:acceptor oxidoreductase family protein [Candidatus Shikimatogenerans bostrichidophilus]
MINDINIIISGFSGEGIQYLGNHLSYIIYKLNYYIKTYSNIPTEILSPTKTQTDISEIFIRFSNTKIRSFLNYKRSILLLTNYLSLKKNIKYIYDKSFLILDFDKVNKKLFKNDNKINKIINRDNYFLLNSKRYINFKKFIKYKIKLSKLNLYKNSLLLGILLYLFNFSKKYSIIFLNKKFKNNNIKYLNYYLIKKGLKLGKKKKIKQFFIKKNKFKLSRSTLLINGNLGIVLGLITGSFINKLGIFYSYYPITPSLTIYKYFKLNKKYINIKIFDSEDEISAICASIGASILKTTFIGIMATSGPGMSLIQESLGLAVVLEIPLIIINVQRVGPSTGYPTKLEQSDLMQAIYGRHGESPLPVFAIYDISNSINLASKIFNLALKLMTPIIILSDIFIANSLSLCKIKKKKKKKKQIQNKKKRQNKCLGGLITNIKTHKHIINKRQNKINSISNSKFTYKFTGYKKSQILVIGWGSTYDIIKESILILNKKKKKIKIGYLHIICLYPIPNKIIENLSYFSNFVLLFELNNKQLFYLIKSYCKINIKIYNYNKITGEPFTTKEIIKYIKTKFKYL